MYGLIYVITNLVNGKRYVGQTTKTLKERTRKHFYDATKANRNQALHHAIRKYGKENFQIKVLIKCNTLKELNHRETLCIKLFNTLSPNGYNLNTGGDNKIVSEETHKKMIEAQKDRKPVSKETRIKMSISRSGNKNGNFGRSMSEKTIDKLSKKIKLLYKNGRKPHNLGGTSGTARPIICLNDDKTYISANRASIELKLDPSSILKVCKGHLKQTKGFKFRFIEDIQKEQSLSK